MTCLSPSDILPVPLDSGITSPLSLQYQTPSRNPLQSPANSQHNRKIPPNRFPTPIKFFPWQLPPIVFTFTSLHSSTPYKNFPAPTGRLLGQLQHIHFTSVFFSSPSNLSSLLFFSFSKLILEVAAIVSISILYRYSSSQTSSVSLTPFSSFDKEHLRVSVLLSFRFPVHAFQADQNKSPSP